MAASSASVPASAGRADDSPESPSGTPAEAETSAPSTTTATVGSIPADARQSIGRPQILRGSAVTMVGFGGGQALSLVSSVILTRLLNRDAYGLYRLANVFLE